MSTRIGIVALGLSALGLLALGRGVLADDTPAAKPNGPAIEWHDDFEKAKAKAAETGKPLIAYFTFDACYWCKRLATACFHEPAVVEVSRGFVWVKVDRDKTPDIPRKFNVSAYPSLLVLGKEGENVYRFSSYQLPKEFIQNLNNGLDRYALYKDGKEWFLPPQRPDKLTDAAAVSSVPAPSEDIAFGSTYLNGSFYLAQSQKISKVDPKTGKVISQFPIREMVCGLCTDGKVIYAATGGWTAGDPIRKYDPESGKLLGQVVTEANKVNKAHGAKGIAYKDGKLFVLEGMAGKVHIVDPASGVVSGKIQFPEKWMAGLAFDGDHFVSSTRTHLLTLDGKTGAVVAKLPVNYWIRTLAVQSGRCSMLEQPIFGFGKKHEQVRLWPKRMLIYTVDVPKSTTVAGGPSDLPAARWAAARAEANREKAKARRQLLGDAIVRFHQYIAAHPAAADVGEAWFELLKAQGQLGDVKAAASAFAAFREKLPTNSFIAPARAELAEALLASGRADLALPILKELLSNATGRANETRLLQNLASIQAQRGDRAAALESYELIKKMKPHVENPRRYSTYEPYEKDLAKIGDELPAPPGKDANGAALDFAAYRGRPLFVHFWQAREGISKDVERINELRARFPTLGVISVNVGDRPAALAAATAKHLLGWPQFHDRDGSYARKAGITFMGLYVHEPKGILLDGNGKIALMPSREGAIETALRIVTGVDDAAADAVGAANAASFPPARTVREISAWLGQASWRSDDRLAADHLARLVSLPLDGLDEAEAAAATVDVLRAATAADNFPAAKAAFAQFNSAHPKSPLATAVRFAFAGASIASGDAEATKQAVYAAIGDRKERDDLWILMDLAAALAVLNDVPGARQAYEKIIEVTNRAGENIWRQYIAALDRVGKKVDHFEGRDLTGASLGTASFRGKVLLIDFWGTWCHACIHEMPHVREAYLRYRDDGFRVVGVVVRDTAENARAFVDRHGYPWPHIVDAENTIAKKHVVVGYPTTILVDREGRVRCIRAMNGGLDVALKLLLKRDLPPLPKLAAR